MALPTLGRGAKAGHEKVGSAEYFLPKRPTFIDLGCLEGDLYEHGYYLRGDMPEDIAVAGIWMLDPLLEQGHFDEETASRFEEGGGPFETTGQAFAEVPTRGSLPGQPFVTGQRGGYVSSYHRAYGDAATGTLRTPPFELRGDLLVMRVGGGRDPQRLRVDVRVGEQIIASFTGRDAEVLTRREVSIAEHRGAFATIEVIDDATGPWGHIMLDEIAQWTPGPRR